MRRRVLRVFLLGIAAHAAAARADTTVGGTITVNTTWTAAGSPYVATSSVAVNNNVTLTVEPGVTVKFVSGARLEVYGTLLAQGTAESPIVFTTSSASPAPGSWQCLYLGWSASASRLSHVAVTYGGAGFSGAIVVDGSSPIFHHLQVTDSSSSGIYVTGSAAMLTLSDAVVSASGSYGLNLAWGADATVTATSFTDNGNYAVSAGPGNLLLDMTGVAASGNGGGSKDGVGYRGGTIAGAESWRPALDWIVLAGVAVDTPGILTIDPGTRVRAAVSGVRFDVWGRLAAIGTAEAPIVFTSLAATPGSWQCLYYYSSSSASRLSYVTVSYGGNGFAAAVMVDGASPVFDHLTVASSSTHGIEVKGAAATLTLSDSALTANLNHGLNLRTGGGATVTNTTFTGNTSYAIGAEPGTRLLGMTGVVASGNGGGTKDAIGYRGGGIAANAAWPAGLEWHVLAGTWINGGVTLTVAAGARVEFAPGTRLEIYGTLTAVGTAASPIVFTSTAASPTPGSWQCLYFLSGSGASRLAYATIAYGGGGWSGAVVLDNSAAVFERVTVSNSSSAGVWIANSTTGVATFRHGAFTGNGSGGIRSNLASPKADARLSYWGAASGPSLGGPGTGQAVAGGVTYEPWLASAPVDPHLFGTFTHLNRTFNPSIGTVTTLVFDTATEGSWSVAIRTPGGALVRTLTGSGAAASVAWDGKDEAGALQPDGTYSYEVASTAGGGELASAAGLTVLDSTKQLTVTGVAAAPAYFSPNADGAQDTTTVAASISFEASWTVTVKDAGGAIVRTGSGTGSALSYVWDGRDGGGAVVADGVYSFEIQATVGTATAGGATSATLDVSLPALAITEPASGVLSNVRQEGSADVGVVGTATDLHLTSWTLEWGAGASPASWTQLATGTTPITASQLALWATLAQTNGAYALRLRATDRAGNASVLVLPITVANFKAWQSALQFNPAAGGTVVYSLDVPFPVDLALRIKNQSGQVVRTLWDGPRAAGVHLDAWDGRDDDGVLVPDGAYLYRVELNEGSSGMVWDLTGQYLNDWNTWNDSLVFSNFDPFNNQPLTFTYNFPKAGLVTIGFAPTNLVAATCSPPQFCLAYNQYEESGPHTVTWAGLDPATGALRKDIRSVALVINRILFSKNAVIVYGSKPSLANVRVSPTVYGPTNGEQTVSFDLATYQSQPAAVTVAFRNLASLSVLRTVTVPSQAPGAVSIPWDGRADNGVLVAPGHYSVTVTATDARGQQVSGQILTTIQY